MYSVCVRARVCVHTCVWKAGPGTAGLGELWAELTVAAGLALIDVGYLCLGFCSPSSRSVGARPLPAPGPRGVLQGRGGGVRAGDHPPATHPKRRLCRKGDWQGSVYLLGNLAWPCGSPTVPGAGAGRPWGLLDGPGQAGWLCCVQSVWRVGPGGRPTIPAGRVPIRAGSPGSPGLQG